MPLAQIKQPHLQRLREHEDSMGAGVCRGQVRDNMRTRLRCSCLGYQEFLASYECSSVRTPRHGRDGFSRYAVPSAHNTAHPSSFQQHNTDPLSTFLVSFIHPEGLFDTRLASCSFSLMNYVRKTVTACDVMVTEP
jgi:hypothetical protein